MVAARGTLYKFPEPNSTLIQASGIRPFKKYPIKANPRNMINSCLDAENTSTKNRLSVAASFESCVSELLQPQDEIEESFSYASWGSNLLQEQRSPVVAFFSGVRSTIVSILDGPQSQAGAAAKASSGERNNPVFPLTRLETGSSCTAGLKVFKRFWFFNQPCRSKNYAAVPPAKTRKIDMMK